MGLEITLFSIAVLFFFCGESIIKNIIVKRSGLIIKVNSISIILRAEL